MSVDWWIWAAFVAFVLGLLALDLLVFQRKAHAVAIREAALWSGVWITLGLGFAGVLWAWRGTVPAEEYLAGYLAEKSLSIDNLFVLAAILAYFSVPAELQRRVLFWGIVGALFFRGVFIVAGAVLLDRFEWTMYVFGVFLVLTGAGFARRELAGRPEGSAVVGLFRRLVPMASGYCGQRFFVRERGRLLATPLLAVLAVVLVKDVVIAIDSIPAAFAVTSDPFLVFSSNAFAILGLHSLYFVLAGALRGLRYLRFGLAAILVFAGAKMAAGELYVVPISATLVVMVGVLGLAVVASLLVGRRRRRPARVKPAPAPVGSGR